MSINAILYICLGFNLLRTFVNEVVSAEEKSLKYKKKTVALVRELTVPTERPPLVGEVGANFSG
jgi:hypothetical protein